MTPSATAPFWLQASAIISLGVAGLCAIIIAIDEARRPQAMWIMNLVWPLTALFGGLLWLAVYFRWGRDRKRQVPASRAVGVWKAGTHCGAGCTLGDLISETLALIFPGAATLFGAGWLFADRMFAVWTMDFAVAFVLGIGFQYFSIMPRPAITPAQRLRRALRTDAASITAWQIGMYGGMAAIQFGWFEPRLGGPARADQPVFWFAMQLAMLCGFATSYPVNWMLVKMGVKEAM